MKYECGHYGCDICGRSKCRGTTLFSVGDYRVCGYCQAAAISFAIQAAERFSVIIDTKKPCGNKKRKEGIDGTGKAERNIREA